MVIGRPDHGFLVLADISGFTEFVTNTELEHGPPIIAALLDAVIVEIAPPLEVQEVEGDAVFALGLDGTLAPPATLLDVLSAGLRGFRTRQRELQADESCSCNACRSVWRLRLKTICHHGIFLPQTIGGRMKLGGSDVILAHCLLKSSVARDTDFVLLTPSALRALDVDPARSGLRPHVEHHDHFGAVECFVGEIARAACAA
jgi:hypothetical protein